MVFVPVVCVLVVGDCVPVVGVILVGVPVVGVLVVGLLMVCILVGLCSHFLRVSHCDRNNHPRQRLEQPCTKLLRQ